MKKAISAVVLLACIATARATGEGFLKPVEIWGSFSFGWLESGFQKDLIDNVLYADGNSAILPIIGARGFFLDPLGIEVSAGIFGRTKADYISYDSLEAYDYTLLNVGPVLRLAFPTGYRSAFALVLGAGANYSMLGLSADTWTATQSIISDIGWYGKSSLAWYIAPGMFFDFTFWYYYMNAHFAGGQKLDGTYYLLAFSIGFGL